MNNEENKREKEKEKEEKTPVKYVATEGTRNSLASGNRNKSKKGRKQLRNSRGRCDRMIGGEGGRKRHGKEVMRKTKRERRREKASPDEDEKGETRGTTKEERRTQWRGCTESYGYR